MAAGPSLDLSAEIAAADFSDGLRDAQRSPRPGYLATWLARVAWDLVRSITRQWLRTSVPWLTTLYATAILAFLEGLSSAMLRSRMVWDSGGTSPWTDWSPAGSVLIVLGVSLTLTALVGAVLVELCLAGWRRVPCTCSWIPGQRPLVFIFLMSVGALIVVAGVLPMLVVVSAVRSTGLLFMFGTGLVATAGILRWRRVHTWADQPLLFEDERYDMVQTLGLTR